MAAVLQFSDPDRASRQSPALSPQHSIRGTSRYSTSTAQQSRIDIHSRRNVGPKRNRAAPGAWPENHAGGPAAQHFNRLCDSSPAAIEFRSTVVLRKGGSLVLAGVANMWGSRFARSRNLYRARAAGLASHRWVRRRGGGLTDGCTVGGPAG